MSKVNNWIPIFGKCEVEKSGLKYIPEVIKEGPNQGQTKITLVKSDVWFESGSIAFEVNVDDTTTGAQILLNHDHPTQYLIGIGAGAAFGIQTYYNNKFETIASSGDFEARPGKYAISIHVIGSRIKLSINGVQVCNAIGNIRKCQPALFLRGESSFIVKIVDIAPDPLKAFVVMQFTDEFNALYHEVIKPTVETYGLKCIRADDVYTSGQILNDITDSIIESTFTVADITPDNPNVFYEVGYAHAIQKPVILLSDSKREKFPFDVSGFRVIIYENTIGGKSKVEERLKKHIESILS